MPRAFYNLVRMTTPTTGVGLVISLGTAVAGFNSFTDANVPDGAVVSCAIADGANSEVGRYTYSLANQTLTRTQIIASTGGGTAINLSGFAQIAISPLAEDMVDTFDSVAAAQAATIPDGTTSIATAGYYAPGDGGGATYAFSAGQPSVSGSYFQSGDGAYWVVAAGNNNVLAFGASANGSFNSAAAFTACQGFNPGRPIYVPGSIGTYVLTQGVTLSGLIGDGPGATIIQINSTTAVGITVPANTSAPTFRGFSLTRQGTPVSGANGIDVSGGTVNSAFFEDIIIRGHWTNFIAGPTDRGRIRNVDCIGSLSDNFVMKNTAANGTLQWQLETVYAVAGAGHGIRLVAVAGPGQITLGQWSRIETFANSGRGLSIEGLSSCPIQGIRANHCFFGGDGNHEVYLDTYNTENNGHQFTACYVEECGTGPTGPTASTPPSNQGSGYFITANNDLIQINDTVSDINSWDGITSSATELIVSGGFIVNNGLAGTSTNQTGINVLAGSLVLTGSKVGQTAVLVTQRYGVVVASGADHCRIENNDLQNNAIGAVLNQSSGSHNRIEGNDGYNPVGISNPTPGASPWTYTAGATRETVYLYGGTISQVSLLPQGFSIVDIGVAPLTIELGPNEGITVTYSATPVMVKSIH